MRKFKQTQVHISPLLRGLMTSNAKAISEEERVRRLNKIGVALERSRQGQASFEDWETIAQAVNYVLGFNRFYLPDDTELTDEQKSAARAVYAMSQRTPMVFTPEEETLILKMVGYLGDIFEVITERELAGVEIYINHKCEAARVRQQIEQPKISRRSRRKPKKK